MSSLDGINGVRRNLLARIGLSAVAACPAQEDAALAPRCPIVFAQNAPQFIIHWADNSANSLELLRPSRCMANHDIEARLCRWMLRARDLSGSDDLPFTQEFLAEMVGVRRTSLTTVAHTLQGAGMISYTRGKIHILDVEGLKESACECYETVKEQYSQLLGSNSDKP